MPSGVSRLGLLKARGMSIRSRMRTSSGICLNGAGEEHEASFDERFPAEVCGEDAANTGGFELGVAQVGDDVAVDAHLSRGDPDLLAGVVLRVQRPQAARSDQQVVDVRPLVADGDRVQDVPARDR